MTDKARCPHCGGEFDWDTLDMADLWRCRGRLETRLEPIWKLANEYMEAFRREPGSRISLKLRIRHLDLLAILWEKEVFEYDGKRYRTSKTKIRDALINVCNVQKTGFKDHNYLKAVLLDGAQRVSAAGETASEERRREEKRRTETENRRTGETEIEEENTMTAAEFREQKGVDSLADQIGRDMP